MITIEFNVGLQQPESTTRFIFSKVTDCMVQNSLFVSMSFHCSSKTTLQGNTKEVLYQKDSNFRIYQVDLCDSDC